MSKEDLSGRPSKDVRQIWPFIRPPLRVRHFIPVYGAISYFLDSQKAKGEHRVTAADLIPKRAKDLIDVPSWPLAENENEFLEGAKTALQNGFVVAYHLAVTSLGLPVIGGIIFSARENKSDQNEVIVGPPALSQDLLGEDKL